MRLLGRYPKWLIAMLVVVVVLDVILLFSGKAGYVLLWATVIFAFAAAGRFLGRRTAQRRQARDEDSPR